MIKPRIFIGSSSERLDIAYAIQENLERDSEPTVWNQGLFNLSSTALDSLMDSLENFDFAIFAFHPDDITLIREEKVKTVRDNLIFELGLFMGRLGQNNVFFLIPRDSPRLHLPTDLLGIIPGTYDSNRADRNLKASLGPFCNQVRLQIENFIYLNMEGFKTESNDIKDIILKKSNAWEFILTKALLEKNIKRIDSIYRNIDDDFIIQRVKSYDGQQFFDWYKEVIINIENYIGLFVKAAQDLKNSWGPKGVSGQPLEIKMSVDKLVQLCDELLDIEMELYRIQPPLGLLPVKKKMKGFSKSLIINPIKEFIVTLEDIIKRIEDSDNETVKMTITLNPIFPSEINDATDDFTAYYKSHGF